MKKAVLLLAILFLIGILAGGTTAVVKRKNDNTPSEGVGGGAESSASLEGLETDYTSRMRKQVKIQSFADFGSEGLSDSLTPNTDNGEWALYTDSDFENDDLGTTGVLCATSTAGNGNLSFYMSKNYDRRNSAFSASFDFGTGETGEIIDSLFYCTLGNSPEKEERVRLLTVHDGKLFAVDKVRGEVDLGLEIGTGDNFISYYVDLARRSLQVWVGVTYKGAFYLETSSTGDLNACSYFGFEVTADPGNAGKGFAIAFLKVYN